MKFSITVMSLSELRHELEIAKSSLNWARDEFENEKLEAETRVRRDAHAGNRTPRASFIAERIARDPGYQAALEQLQEAQQDVNNLATEIRRREERQAARRALAPLTPLKNDGTEAH